MVASEKGGFSAAASLLSLANGSSDQLALVAAAAIGLGNFPAQYVLARWADLHGGCVVLLLCAGILATALLTLALWPGALVVMSLVIGAAGGLYLVAIAYAAGSLLSASLTGAALAGIGVRGTLLAFSGLALILLAMLVGVQVWQWPRSATAAKFRCVWRTV